MTVTSENKRNQYTITEAQVVFPYTFRILAQAHLLVILTTAAGVETELELTTNYTVSGVGAAGGGNVTTCGDNSPYTTGDTITIIRDVPLTQLIDYVENDAFPAESHEKGLDLATMILQEFAEKLDRAIFLTKSSIYSGLKLPDPVAQKLLQWKDDLSGLVNVSPYSEGELTVTDYIKNLLNDEDAAEARATLKIPITNPLSIPPSAFVPRLDTYDWDQSYRWLKNRTVLSVQTFSAPLYLPQGAIVTKAVLYGYRDVSDASSILTLNVKGTTRVATDFVMSAIEANWSDGYGSIEDTTIDYATIDNVNKHYSVTLGINPFESVDDTFFTGAVIEFTLP